MSLDQDECTEIPGICANGRCENTEGSFRCICQAGYTLNQAKSFCISKFSKKCGTYAGHYLSLIVILPLLQCLDICYFLGAVQGFCYQRVVNNYCVDQSPTNTTKFDCCCSEKKPAGWGPLCERCPVQGTRELHVKHSHFHVIILCFSLNSSCISSHNNVCKLFFICSRILNPMPKRNSANCKSCRFVTR